MRSIKKSILFVSLIFASLFLSAQPQSNTGAQGGGNAAQGNCVPPPCPVPIDGGIGFLIAAGLAYGSKRLYDARKHFKS